MHCITHLVDISRSYASHSTLLISLHSSFISGKRGEGGGGGVVEEGGSGFYIVTVPGYMHLFFGNFI